MLCSEKKFKLKDGRIAVLRSPKEEDAVELLALLKDVTRETDFLLRAPEECTMTEEQETAWINNARSSPNTAVFLCEVDGEIAGDCEIVFLSRLKLRHRAVVGISLRKVYWNLGIGTAMFEEMICLAKERGGIIQLELEVMEGNDRAIHLYEKMGFRIVAARPNAFSLEDGSLRDEYIMVRAL